VSSVPLGRADVKIFSAQRVFGRQSSSFINHHSSIFISPFIIDKLKIKMVQKQGALLCSLF